MPETELKFLDPADTASRTAWDSAVARLPGGTIFHTTAWMDVIADGLGLEPRFAFLSGPGGSMQALVPLFRAGGWARPLRWVNLPQGCASEPLAPDQKTASLLVGHVAYAAAKDDATALLLRTARHLRPRLPEGWELRRETPMLHHILDLRGAGDVQSLPRIQREQRQKVRSVRDRLARHGVHVQRASAGEVDAFTRDVHRILLRKHGHLGLPQRFFEALLLHLGPAARLTTVGRGRGSALGFVVSVSGNDCCHLLYGSGLPTKAGNEAYRIAVATEIDMAIRSGRSYLDLAETGAGQAGLVYFKETWGADRVDGSYLVIARNGAPSGLRDMSRGRLAVLQRAFQFVPVGVSLRIAGPIHKAMQ
jgi:Acetyltransferase (GNAT) domain